MMGWIIFFAGIVALAGIYAMLCLALNIESGFLGLWDLGTVGIFAVGAYTYVLTTLDVPGSIALGLPMWAGFLLAGAVSGLVALLIGIPSLRLRAEYLLITTFAFAEVIRQVFINERWLTNGNIGFYGLSRPFDSYFSSQNYLLFFSIFVLVLLFILYKIAQRWSYSPFGRVLRSTRENEQVTLSTGKEIYRIKLVGFVLSSVLVGFIGAIYVWYSSIILPNMFTSTVTFTVWTAVVIGGIGNNRGVVFGAFLLIFAQEFTRFFQVSSDMAVVLSSLRWVVMGMLLVFVLRFRPQGIFKEKIPSVESIYKFNSAKVGVDHDDAQSTRA